MNFRFFLFFFWHHKWADHSKKKQSNCVAHQGDEQNCPLSTVERLAVERSKFKMNQWKRKTIPSLVDSQHRWSYLRCFINTFVSRVRIHTTQEIIKNELISFNVLLRLRRASTIKFVIVGKWPRKLSVRANVHRPFGNSAIVLFANFSLEYWKFPRHRLIITKFDVWMGLCGHKWQ